MSVQAGIWNFDSQPVDAKLLAEFNQALKEQAPDGEFTLVDEGVAMLYRPFHTTRESRREKQPHITRRGLVLTWDGRLDNRGELLSELGTDLDPTASDVEIVAAALEHWGTQAFSRIIGDWALALWNPAEASLTLAKDYLGLRHLYFLRSANKIVWSTDLGSLALSSRSTLSLDDRYIAGYLAHYPPLQLTPYKEIGSVAAGTAVVATKKGLVEHRYWHFRPANRIRYKNDTEYELHFRYLLRQAVRRRLRSDSPILLELSGGIDSSAITCMADDILAKGEVAPLELDTLSTYDPREPQGDERNYFTIIEAKRGKRGHHFDRSRYEDSFTIDTLHFRSVPGPVRDQGRFKKDLLALFRERGYRSILSGIGGDELLGGISTPEPQLADLIVLPRPVELWKQLIAWSLVKKRPWIHLLASTLTTLLPGFLRAECTKGAKLPSWINEHFARRHSMVASGFGLGEPLSFWLPSRREYAQTLTALRRQFAFLQPTSLNFLEKRYPFLDRDLVEFLLAIPKTQLLRAGERRSLLRRALAGIVPKEILWRRTKGFVTRGVLTGFRTRSREIEDLFTDSLSQRLGYLDERSFQEAMRAAANGDAKEMIYLLKGLYLEQWLRCLSASGIVHFNLELFESLEQPALTR